VGEGLSFVRFSFVHFTFAHRFSFTIFHSLVFNFEFLRNIWYLAAGHPGHPQEDIILHHPFPQRAHFIDVKETFVFCILFFSIATDPSKNVIYFYLKFLIQIIIMPLSFT
jgi:hypothetical protein